MFVPDFDKEKHIYTWNGVPKVSPTQLFSRVGVRKDEDSEFRSISGVEFMNSETAMILGTEFHKIPELIFNGKEPDYDARLQPWVNSLNMFLAQHSYLLGDSRKLVECILYSPKYGYAGTLDLFSFIEDTSGRLWLIDWKTSVSIAKHYKWQLAAYTQLIRESFDLGNKGIHTMTVQLRPDKFPQLETRKPTEVMMDLNMFISILNVFNITQKLYTHNLTKG